MRDIKALRFAKNTCETSCAMATLVYARVSTQDQHLSGQLETLKAAGATTIYREKVSGVRTDRPQLAKLMAKIGPGDVVVVTKLDRLGRSTRELLDLIGLISEAGAAFRSLGDPLWGHDKFAREAAEAPPRRNRGIREGFDPRAHRRRPQTGHGCWREVRSQA